MRKWMRDRLQRRKQKKTGKTDQPAPAPLQPAYFDPAENDEAAESQAAEVESSSEGSALEPGIEAAPADTSSEPPEPSASQSPSGGASQRGRSRRRGGRGRGGRGRQQAVAQAFAPAAAKGAVVSPVGETAEETQPEIEPEIEPARPAKTAAAATIPTKVVVPTAPARPPKGIVVLAIGLPGSGKSTWFKRHNVTPLSSDMLRALLFDDIREQRFQDLVFSNLRSMLKARLIARRPMNYVDATNLTPKEREHWIKLAKDYNYEVHAVFFDVPLEVCVERHGRRDNVVPEDVMRRMAAKLKPPSFDEGFAKITVVRVKKKSEPALSE